MANITSIAEKLGISASTVSRALKRPHLVSEETRNRIMKEAMAQGYVNSINQTDLPLIGIVAADLTNSFSNTITSSILDTIAVSEYQTLIACTNESTINENQILKKWSTLPLEGVIAMPASSNSQALIEFAKHTPTVILDRDIEGIKADKVLVNNRLGVELGIKHLIELGHKHILFLCGNKQVYTFKERYEAANNDLYPEIKIDRIELNKLKYEELYMGAFEYVNTLCRSNHKNMPTAIFASNNATTAGSLYALSLNNIHLGKDISIICFGDSRWTQFYPTSITVISQPVDQIGVTAVNHLMQRIADRSLDYATTILDPMLIPRASTALIN